MPDEQRDSEADLVLEPMNLCDVSRHRNILKETDGEKEEIGLPPTNPHLFFSAAMGTQRESRLAEQRRLRRLRAWRRAIMKARCLGDPWEKFHLDEYPTEKARRYRYNALRKTWVTDDVVVKMQPEPFSHGAMRECFRLKKLSNFTHSADWKRDSNNYVAKRYMDAVERDAYFQDVQLQMDAKLWGEEYNRHNPPKKVDIFQMAVLELAERDGCPLYHVEHFIEGDYVKYNSNSGYVKDTSNNEHIRLTPHAFSHFSFERSGHELLIVDIQGVGDLYTDPQIHTASGLEYGEGNLGTRGMALFFHTHVCNRICKSLGLSPFNLAPSELNETGIQNIKKSQEKGLTVLRGQEEMCVMPSYKEKNRLWGRCLPRTMSEPIARPRTISESSGFQSLTPPESPNSLSLDDGDDHEHEHPSVNFTISCPASDSDYDSVSNSESERSVVRRRRRLDSESGSVMNEDDHLLFHNDVNRKARPSCILPPDPNMLEIPNNESILGVVHLQLCRYHELRRFTSPDSSWYDHDAAFFHLEYAARCGVPEARMSLAQMLLGLQHDILPDMELERTEENEDRGFSLLLEAANSGDSNVMVIVGKAFDTGIMLGSRSKDWAQAKFWYEKAVEEGGTEENPTYQLQARVAEMLRTGGPALSKDPLRSGELYTEAAENAMAAMKGRLANEWYQLAEEAWAECEEEEGEQEE